MKQSLLILISIILLLTLTLALLLRPKWLEIKPCLESRDLKVLSPCLDKFPPLIPYLQKANLFIKSNTLNQGLSLFSDISPLLPFKDYLLGLNQPHPTTYLVLLQNDKELRTNGGYFGSYVVITADDGRFSFRFQDIGVPDGQLIGHVDPPSPVQRSFQNGWFKLRDSDWDPNWPTTTTAIRWFLEKGKEINPDILITLSLSDIKKVIDITGSFDVPEYNMSITSDNLYSLLQNQAEVGFFPGSTSKKDVLSATGKALIAHLSSLDHEKQLALSQVILNGLNRQNILVNSQNSSFQEVITKKNWAGLWQPVLCKAQGCISDTVAIIEANMGANKANCCVTRQTTHHIIRNDSQISHQISIQYDNASPLENPLPPRFYGGNYLDYLRFYIPKTAIDIKVDASPTLPETLVIYPKPYPNYPNDYLDIDKDKDGFQEVGFFHTTKAGTKSSLTVSYNLPIQSNQPYELNILKQHGLDTSPQNINLFGKSLSTSLESSFSVSE